MTKVRITSQRSTGDATFTRQFQCETQMCSLNAQGVGYYKHLHALWSEAAVLSPAWGMLSREHSLLLAVSALVPQSRAGMSQPLRTRSGLRVNLSQRMRTRGPSDALQCQWALCTQPKTGASPEGSPHTCVTASSSAPTVLLYKPTPLGLQFAERP